MLRTTLIGLAMVTLAATLTFAEPRVRVEYHAGVPRVLLEGDYSGSRYRVARASEPGGPFVPVLEDEVLCTGLCFADDPAAIAGRVSWYRFDLVCSDGSAVTFGPYPVAISAELARRVSAAVFPNPGGSPMRVVLNLAGASSEPALPASAVLYDLLGRAVRTLYRGPLSRGSTRLEWDGRDDHGRVLGPGLYYLRLASPLGAYTTKVFRIR